jgi:NAD-dependent oxidoreductase involved in siderophore biosynthesis
MKVQEAVMAFSQSDKIKSGLIWVSQALELLAGLSITEQQGAERIIKSIIAMISHEVHLGRKLANDVSWDEVEKHIDMALVMINSNMVQESGFHLTRSLSQVTGIAHRSMSVLKDEGVL